MFSGNIPQKWPAHLATSCSVSIMTLHSETELKTKKEGKPTHFFPSGDEPLLFFYKSQSPECRSTSRGLKVKYIPAAYS